MNKKPPPSPLLHLPTSTKVMPTLQGVERLVIELSVEKHRAVKMRAVALGKSLKDYALYAIELHADQAIAEALAHPDRPRIEGGAWHQKRIAIDIPPEDASRVREKGKDFKTMREFVVRCIEIEMAVSEASK